MHYSESLVKLAIDIYAATGSGPMVAKKLDVSIKKAYALLAAGGVALQGKPPEQRTKHRLTGEALNSAIADYMNGMRSVELEEKYQVCMWTIREAVRRSGEDLRKKGGTGRTFTPEELERMVELHRSGLTQTQVAAALKSNQSTINQTLKRLGEHVEGNYARGPKSPGWKGGRVMCGENKKYVGVYVDREDPLVCMSSISGYALEHRLVVARSLGRPLARHETVHHINGDTTDNRLENLQLRSGQHGAGVIHRCRDCGSTNIESTTIT